MDTMKKYKNQNIDINRIYMDLGQIMEEEPDQETERNHVRAYGYQESVGNFDDYYSPP